MACRGIWVRSGGNHSFGITATPEAGVELLSVAVRRESRVTGNVLEQGSDSIVQPPAGTAWTPNGTPVTVNARQRCFYELFIEPVGGKAKITISIDEMTFDFDCESKEFPMITGEFRLTTF